MAQGKQTPSGAARWTEEQVELLLETVRSSRTARDAFTIVAEQIGKSAGTVQQKYYALQRLAAGGSAPAKRTPAKSVKRSARAATPATRSPQRPSPANVRVPTGAQLRTLSADELVALARAVKTEVDRRRSELEAAANLFR